MTAMPDFAVHATWPELLPEAAEERLLELVPGTVVSHPAAGGTVVAVPVTSPSIVGALAQASSIALDFLDHVDAAPASVSIDPLED